MTKTDKLHALINTYCDGNKGAFAEMIGTTPNTVYNWIARNTFDAELIHKMCAGVNGDWLLSDDDALPMINDKATPTANDMAYDAATMLDALRSQLSIKDEQIKSLLSILATMSLAINTAKCFTNEIHGKDNNKIINKL